MGYQSLDTLDSFIRSGQIPAAHTFTCSPARVTLKYIIPGTHGRKNFLYYFFILKTLPEHAAGVADKSVFFNPADGVVNHLAGFIESEF